MRYFVFLLLIIALSLNSTFAVTPIDKHNKADLETAQVALSSGEYKRSFKLYKRAAKKNNPLAMFTLGLFYQNGWGMPVQIEKACEWFDKAAQHKIVAAQHFLAECLLAGTHQTADPAAAALWFLKAAEAGHLISFCSLAELYINGTGVIKDPTKGINYCRKAADSGIVAAQLKMGLFLSGSDDHIRDIDQAALWFKSAAAHNLTEASYYLAMLYRDHYQNNDTALLWFEKAASQGYRPAYYPTAELYFQTPASKETGMPEAYILAKSYLWLSAARLRENNPERQKHIDHMLAITLEIMPATWIPDLDRKVNGHLSQHPAK